MRRLFDWVVIAALLVLIVTGAGAALSLPTVRHIISSLWNLPDRLPALPANGQVHYQPGAEDDARVVAALLPDAITRIEAVHGRRFAYPVTVGVRDSGGLCGCKQTRVCRSRWCHILRTGESDA
jgi:hypothetical protein